MRTFIFIAFLGLSMRTFSADKNKVDQDKNLEMAIADYKEKNNALQSSTDLKLDKKLLVNLFNSMLCLKEISKTTDQNVINELLKEFEASSIIKSKLDKLQNDKEFSEEFFRAILVASKKGDKVCAFTLDENTGGKLVQKRERESDIKKYERIVSLKTTIHPVFVKLINDLEKQKARLNTPMSGGLELEEDKFEKNFEVVYEFQVKYVEAKSLAILSLLPSHCIEVIKKNYLLYCAKNPQLAEIKGLFTKYLLCADDNLLKLDKTCSYEKSFTAI